MNENKISAGKGSIITQIKSANFNITSSPIHNIEHCGFCSKFLDNYKSKIYSNSTCMDLDSHCKNLLNIDSLENYLCYYFFELLSKQDNKYVLPTLIISEGFSAVETKKLQKYNDPLMIISDDYNLYMVIGEGGIGKSHFLSKLFSSLIYYSLTTDQAIIPIWANCDNFGQDSSNPKEWLFTFLNEKFNNLNIESLIHDQNKKVYFIIDSINGMQYSDNEDFENKIILWSNFIKEYCELYPNVSFILSSRNIAALDYFENKNQRKVYISSFDENQILEFISMSISDIDIQGRLSDLVNEHKDMPFIGIPYFLKKLIECPYQNISIENKTDIVLLYVASLFESDSTTSSRKKVKRFYGSRQINDLICNGVYFFDVMFNIAYYCQSKNKKVLSSVDVNSLYPNSNISIILDISIETKILVKDGAGYKFSHPILQECFSAIYIFAKLNGDYDAKSIIPFDDQTMNLEVIPHLYNLVLDKHSFINSLISCNQLSYAAECILNNGDELKRAVSEAIIKALHNETCTNKDTVSLGFYLGHIGDQRFIVNDKFIEPPLASVSRLNKIKVAIFPVTNKEYSFFLYDNGYSNRAYWDQANRDGWFNYNNVFSAMFKFWQDIRARFKSREQALEEFCKNQAVDIEQCAYLAWFLNMSDDDVRDILLELYAKEKYTQPLLWDNPSYNNPSQPVVGVSYYEALAYCTWLSDKTKRNYRLPTNEEWDSMANSDKKRFAFSGDISSENCNTIEADYQIILPVGILEKNKSPEGIYDVNGNIFEWTSSKYHYDLNPLDIQYIAKGGSWLQGKDRAVSKYVGRAKAWCRNSDVGFRMCLDENF